MSDQPRAIALYTKPACVQCDATKRKLDKLGYEYTVVDITEEPDAYDYVVELGAKSAPVVVLDDGTTWFGHRPDLIDKIGA